jgi:hypothetical protein
VQLGFRDILRRVDVREAQLSVDARLSGYELSDEEAVAFMRDIQRVGKAIKELTRAVRLNYEIHGNMIPHLHVSAYVQR